MKSRKQLEQLAHTIAEMQARLEEQARTIQSYHQAESPWNEIASVPFRAAPMPVLVDPDRLYTTPRCLTPIPRTGTRCTRYLDHDGFCDDETADEPPAPVEPDVTYSLPGEPPTGRRVQRGNLIYTRDPDGVWSETHVNDPDGPRFRLTWGEILTRGTVTLMPPTDQEKADELLYGPIGARWGNPDQPCWYGYGEPGGVPCALGQGHIAPHRDTEGNALGETDETPMAARINAAVPPGTDRDICTCGHPEAHREDCPRNPFNTPNAHTGEEPF